MKLDVDKIKFSPSSIAKLMVEPKEKSPKQVYLDTVQILEKKQSEYGEIANKETKKAINLASQIEKISEQLVELKANQNALHIAKTVQKYLSEVYVKAKYNRKKNIETKYTTKGLQVEEDSITLFSMVLGRYIKSTRSKFENDYIIGTPDIVLDPNDKDLLTLKLNEIDGVWQVPNDLGIVSDRLVIDIKSSYDIFTFFEQNVKDLNQTYFWQLQSYMWLTGSASAQLAYCLINTPIALVSDEKRRLQWKMGVTDPDQSPEYMEACEELDRLHSYDDIPLTERLILIDVPRDDSAIEKIKSKVIEARKYIAENFNCE